MISRGSRVMWGLLGVVVLFALSVSEVSSAADETYTIVKQFKKTDYANEGDFIDTKGSGASAVKSLKASVSLGEAVNMCDPASPGSLLVCLDGAAKDEVGALAKLKATVGGKDIELNGIGTGGNKGPCYAAGACEIWAKEACGDSKDFLLTSEAISSLTTASLTINFLYSGRVVKKLDTKEGKIKVDSVTSSLVGKKLGTCTGLKFVVEEAAGKFTCVDSDGESKASYYVMETVSSALDAMTATDIDKTNPGTEVDLKCKAAEPGPNPDPSPKPTESPTTKAPIKPTSGADGRLGSVSGVFVAATITTLGVVAMSGN